MLEVVGSAVMFGIGCAEGLVEMGFTLFVLLPKLMSPIKFFPTVHLVRVKEFTQLRPRRTIRKYFCR